jgi:predicted DNA-binding transcriptional regulator AlpA
VSVTQDSGHQKAAASFVLLTPKETANRLKVSLSWLAKARMRGDGPPYIRVGRSIRYSEAALLQWMKITPASFDQRAVELDVYFRTSLYINRNEEE